MFWALHQIFALVVVVMFPIVLIALACLLEWIGERTNFCKKLIDRLGFGDDTAGYLNRKGDHR